LLYLYPVRFLFRVMPAGLVRNGVELALPVVPMLFRAARREVERKLTTALGASDETSRRIAERFLANLVRRMRDDLIGDRLLASGQLPRVELAGLDHLESARQAGKGVMLVSGHFYATRLAKRYLAEIGYPILSVRHHSPPDTQMGRLGSRWLQKRYIEFLHGVIREEVLLDDPECTLKIFARLRSGGLVHIYLDAPFSHEQMRLPFLGRNPRFPAGFLRIVRLSGCALVPMTCLGHSSRLVIRFEEPVWPGDSGGPEEFTARNLPPLVRWLEAQIRAYPDEWDAWRFRL
jgi:KDO2-lipid IV(A) lauroyltransferase